MRERTIFLHGFSKAFAMTGFRIGYACAPAPLTEAMMKIHQYGILCAAITAQDAALEALEQGAPDVETMRNQYQLRRNFVVQSFNEMGLECFKPFGSFYVFPNISRTGLSSQEFSVRLLREKSVAVVPGPAFGPSGEGFVRRLLCDGVRPIEDRHDAHRRVCARNAPAPAWPRKLLPMSIVRKAVLLAAGRGTRMRELTDDLPKPMIAVRGKPILLHIVEGLRDAGVERFLIVVGYRAEVVRDFFGDGHCFGTRVEYVTQEVQDGTGRVVDLAREFSGAGSLCAQLWGHPGGSGELPAARESRRGA